MDPLVAGVWADPFAFSEGAFALAGLGGLGGSIASCTMRWILAISGLPVLICGGTKETVLIFWSLAFNASGMKVLN